MFEQIQTLLAAKAKVQQALHTDEVVLERIPRTMEKRKAQLRELDAQIAELKAKVDAATKGK